MNLQTNFQEINQTLQRPINCLLDGDRNIRKGGLTTINQLLFSKPTPLIIQIFQKTKLYKNLCSVIQDPIQKHRETALKIVKRYLQLGNQENNLNTDIVETFLKTIIARVNTTPFAETCEQLRLEISRMFLLFLRYPQQMIANLSELSNALSRCLADSFPDLKKQSCAVIDQLTKENNIRFKIGYTSTNVVKALANNLGHQHAAVRKAAIQSLGNLLITQSCGHNFQHVKHAIQSSSFNKSFQVRKSTFLCVSKLLNYFSIKLLSQYESVLVSILLNGLSDESEQIVNLVKTLLEEAGNNLMELESSSKKMVQEKTI